MKRYENFVGLTEVKAAQARVVERERKFIQQQELRREAQAKITDVQKKIKVTVTSYIPAGRVDVFHSAPDFGIHTIQK